ncbi:glycosyltransferase family 4 protein [Microcoleus sp. FACHB-68]|uniref:glycosyltransferase family 4 protein n=1 Tax=Microcoleus sp. FACHB-68 TaxID=2692826 RepID=UPI0016846901|nr:glycosyltransferase family 4 protein [Microcoleus sp. FACHB-68]MBD1936540.1 glycosyltransferase family 4 protein [Microcoleus sp. FACHB-68]
MNQNVKAPAPDIFVFLEVFSSEGGIQSYVKDILKAYVSISAGTAEVFLLRDSPECQNPFASTLPTIAPKLKFHYLKTLPPSLGRLRLAITLLRCLLQQRPRRVFCGHIKLAPLVELLCRPLGIPYTVLTYGKEVWEPLPANYQKALRQADSIWTISRYSRERACAANNLDRQAFQILPCAVDGDVFTPGEKDPAFVEKYGLAGTGVFMTVARLWSGDIYKGVDVTIRALPHLLQKYPEVKYLIVGRGDDQPRLAQLAQDLGVADRVVFAGFVRAEDLPAHYRLADAYIMPSQEGFGIVYLEAMACGVPVVAGEADGSAEPLLDGKLGWRVPHRDPEAVAGACMEILKGEDSRCEGVWLRQQVLEHFSTATFTFRLKQLLDL